MGQHTRPRLYSESFAPWCEKARWALDHHGIRYRNIEHVPLLGELRLRWIARRTRGRATVPLLVTNGTRLNDSLLIAHWAENTGMGSPLFPSEWTDNIASWNHRSESLMEAGRALLLPRLLANDAALLEQLPPFIPSIFRPGMKPAATAGVKFIMRKYNTTAGKQEEHEAAAREMLYTMRNALENSNRYLVGDRFTYADIAMAGALQFFAPVAEDFIRLGPATRTAWTHALIAAEYTDLVEWRDRLYIEHRNPGKRS